MYYWLKRISRTGVVDSVTLRGHVVHEYAAVHRVDQAVIAKLAVSQVDTRVGEAHTHKNSTQRAIDCRVDTQLRAWHEDQASRVKKEAVSLVSGTNVCQVPATDQSRAIKYLDAEAATTVESDHAALEEEDVDLIGAGAETALQNA